VRAYNAIKNSQAALALPPWRVIDHAGPAAQVFTRTSGKLLSDGIPGFFTYNGFQTVLLPRIPGAVAAAANEAKSVTESAVTLNPGAVRALIDDTTNLYARDFILTWDQLLADVTVRPFRNNAEAADVIGTLSGPSTPLKPFLRAVAAETKMNRPAAAAAAGAVAATPAGQALGAIGQVTGLAPAAPGLAIDQHFMPLHQFVAGAETGQSQLDNLIRQLGELYMQLNSQPAAGGALPSGGAVNTLSGQISRLPQPLNRMVSQVTGGSTNLAAGAARTTIQGLYTSTVLPFCRQALEGRYPLASTGTNDVTPGDFQQMFRRGGTLDAFFTNNLQPFVDTTTSPWRSQRAELALSPAALSQFERARRIRDSFFPGDGAALMTEFTLTPIELSAQAREVLFDADGQQLTFSRGPIVPQRMQWPAPNGVGRARLVFTRLDGQTEAIEATGPWALFRLLDRATVSGNLPDQLTVGFNVSGLTASFQLRAASVRNPFRAREQFQCPAQL
jgi:type VI secretion system protein ImpL